jgi:hypothetical protein
MRQLLRGRADPSAPRDVHRDMPRAHARPGVRLNLISSVDGATSVDGASGSLGGPADHEVFQAVRSVTDVVVVDEQDEDFLFLRYRRGRETR